jgi:hypothetical protein
MCRHSATPGNDIRVDLMSSSHKGYVLDLLVTLHKLLTDRENPDRWLLEYCDIGGGGEDPDINNMPHPYSYQRIQQKIRQMGGPEFDAGCLAQRAKRLRLNDKMTA